MRLVAAALIVLAVVVGSTWGGRAVATNGCGLVNEPCCDFEVINAPIGENGCQEGLACVQNLCVAINAPAMSPGVLVGVASALFGLGIAWLRIRGPRSRTAPSIDS